jgi:hypothetical protein
VDPYNHPTPTLWEENERNYNNDNHHHTTMRAGYPQNQVGLLAIRYPLNTMTKKKITGRHAPKRKSPDHTTFEERKYASSSIQTKKLFTLPHCFRQ